MSIDRHQYGSIKGSSTTYCLTELLDVLYRGTDRPKCNTVSSLVWRNSLKGFWLCWSYSSHQNFVWSWCESWNHSLDCWFPYISSPESTYQSATSSWETLSCGVPQGTKFGPITFIGMIDSAASDFKTHSFKYVDDLSLPEVRPANQPSLLVRLTRMFETLMTRLTVTISISSPPSVSLCKCALWETLPIFQFLRSMVKSLRWLLRPSFWSWLSSPIWPGTCR